MSRMLASPERFAVAAFDALLANIAILDSGGMIIAVNRAWERFALANGAADNGLGADYLAICEATQGEDRVYAMGIASDIRAVLADQEEGETEYPCELADGTHYYLARVSGFVQDGGRFAVVAHEDITRRKRAELEVHALNQTLERRVLERSGQLEAQNAELTRVGEILEKNNLALIESNLQLAQFAHVASHDLQEPLRIMGTYSDMLRHRYQDVLDARGQNYLNHVTEQVTRARQMVRDVLAYSNVKGHNKTEVLELEALWNEAVHFMTWPPDVSLSCGPLPEVKANPAQIRQLLANLLGNSLKFRSEEPLEISLSEVRSSDTRRPDMAEGMTELVLRDNGIGIASEYREQVFGMFQRLHSRAAFGVQSSGGNGIGLAVCKRIVEEHGGAIWIGEPPADGHGAGGTAIHFTLPPA
ncbi:sensor histidine kinase [Deinococcus altitudinis]|uniref:sensor histidine kinase n=1 Tax=Deinococcus altitudinis TaxID=468914 RepID=UPI00389221C1